MPDAVKNLKIKQSVDFKDVRWAKVLDLLTTKFHLSFFEADSALKDFLKRFSRPFNLFWFLNPSLTVMDNKIIAALCESLGADSIMLRREYAFRAGMVRMDYRQRIEFEPVLKVAEGGKTGSCLPFIELTVLGRIFLLYSVREVLFVQLLITLMAICFYVVVVGLLLYGLAILVVFLSVPGETTALATRHAPFGLALLCALVGIAAICGRAVLNLAQLLKKRLRRKD